MNKRKRKRKMTLRGRIVLTILAIIALTIIMSIFAKKADTADSSSTDNDIITTPLTMTVEMIETSVAKTETTTKPSIITTIATTQTTSTTTSTSTSTTSTTKASTTKAEATTSTTETCITTAVPISVNDLYESISQDVSIPTGMSKEQFSSWMTDLSSFLYRLECNDSYIPYDGFFERNSITIWELCQEKNVNEAFFVGLIGAESGWVMHESHVIKHNYTSIMWSDGLASYSTEYEGLEAATSLINNTYANMTLYEMASIYCPDIPETDVDESKQWISLVSSCIDLAIQNMQD